MVSLNVFGDLIVTGMYVALVSDRTYHKKILLVALTISILLLETQNLIGIVVTSAFSKLLFFNLSRLLIEIKACYSEIPHGHESQNNWINMKNFSRNIIGADKKGFEQQLIDLLNTQQTKYCCFTGN